MSEHDYDGLVRRLFNEVVTHGRVNLINELYGADFVDHAPGPGQPPGRNGIIEVVKRYRAAVPDLKVTVEDVIVSGNRVVTRETWRGTHRRDIASVRATNKPFSMTRMHIFRFHRGRIVEEWTAGSVLDLLRSMGTDEQPR